MVVGIDVHKQSHTAALLDERGALIETLTIANSAEEPRNAGSASTAPSKR